MDPDSSTSPRARCISKLALTHDFRASPPCVVLDTNVVLDWLLFADPTSHPLAAAVRNRLIIWVATGRMRDEFSTVLERGLALRHGADPQALLACWDAYAAMQPTPAAGEPPARLRCSDPSDQMFFDLALAAGARQLVSRDLAVLRLARPAAAVGLAVITPAQWAVPK